MRLEDLSDYLRLRRRAENPWQVVRFRRVRELDRELVVRFRGQPPFYLRGGRSDYHMFHRIFLRDEYRVRALPGAEAGSAVDCIVDLGGNIGLFAARAAIARARRVITYEPVPELFRLLLRNTSGFPGVAAVNAAVAGVAQPLRIFLPKSEKTTGVSSAYRNADDLLSERSILAEATTLDAVFAAHSIERCDLLKVDVEGAEYEILHAASAATMARIGRIAGEYHDVNREDPRTRVTAWQGFLEGAGFEVEIAPHPRKPNHGMFFAVRRNGSANF